MKKNRNSFFNESSYSYGGYYPNNMMNPNMMPSMSSNFSESFYSGPGYPMNNNMNNTSIDYSDIDARLSKIERSINRLDSRLTKLETTSSTKIENIENNNNMYMV